MNKGKKITTFFVIGFKYISNFDMPRIEHVSRKMSLEQKT